MATEYVVLTTGDRNNRSRVVVHTEVPAGNNAVGTPWSTAVIEHLGTPVESAVPPSVIARTPALATRQAELDAGTRYEWELTVEYDADDTPANKQTEIENQIAAAEGAEVSRLQNLLRFWGHTGTVT